MLPNGAGVVRTDEGATVIFRYEGRTVFGIGPTGPGLGAQLLVIWFESDDERYRWMNDALCVIEGRIASPADIRFRVYRCVDETL